MRRLFFTLALLALSACGSNVGQGPSEVLVGMQSIPDGVILDEDALYWRAAADVWRANKDGTVARILVPATLVGDLVEQGDELFWQADDRIMSVPKTGGALREVTRVEGGRRILRPPAVDETDVYFIDDQAALLRAPRAGGASEVVLQLTGNLTGTVAVDGDRIYYAQMGGVYQQSKTDPLDGSLVASSSYAPDHLVIADGVPYWIEARELGVALVAFAKLAPDESAVVELLTELRGVGRPVIVGRDVMFTEDNQIHRIKSDGDDDHVVSVGPATSIAADPIWIYYTDRDAGEIRRTRLPH